MNHTGRGLYGLVGVVMLCAAGHAQGPAISAPPAAMPVSSLEGADGPVLQATTPAPARPAQLPPLPVSHLDERRATELDGPRRLSITFSQALPITEVLMLLVRGTPFSVVTDASISGSFIGELKDLTMRQAVEAVLFPLRLEYVLDGSVIRVFPRRPETRLFEVNYLAVRRTLQRRVTTSSAVGANEPGVALSTTADSDVFGQVDAGVKALLSPSGQYHVDRQAGLVHVTDFADRLDRIGAYLDAFHVRVTRQVRLDARILEVIPTAREGVDWTAVAARMGIAARPGAPLTTAGIRTTDPDALVKAIGEQGVTRLLAAPHAVTMHNEPALIRATTNEVYFAHRSARGESGGVDSIPMSVAEGVTLTVTPYIGSDGVLQLNIAPTWAEKTADAKSSDGDLVPVLRVSEADTVVRVKEGETVVISGLLHERTEARPSTGFSGLFGGQQRRTVRVELVVLLTPTLVFPGVTANEGVR